MSLPVKNMLPELKNRIAITQEIIDTIPDFKNIDDYLTWCDGPVAQGCVWQQYSINGFRRLLVSVINSLHYAGIIDVPLLINTECREMIVEHFRIMQGHDRRFIAMSEEKRRLEQEEKTAESSGNPA